VTDLKVETEPAEVGLDAERLRRIDTRLARYVDEGKLPGWLVTVSRHGKLVHVASCGQRDVEAGLPVEADTIWRLYSMSKPITSVAAMMLYEEGAFELTDPVSKFVESFGNVRVFAGGTDLLPVTVPATEPVRIWHLLTHTAGLTYGFHRAHPVDAMYRAAGFDVGQRPAMELAAACDVWASKPLLFQPGSEWTYSVATDVLGRVVEVASGMSLDEFFASRIFGPLGMTDTGFYATPEQLPRLSALYARGPGDKAVRADKMDEARQAPIMLSGGGEHVVLGGSGRGAGGLHVHAAHPVQRAPAAVPVATAGVPGDHVICVAGNVELAANRVKARVAGYSTVRVIRPSGRFAAQQAQ
jgi:CubicO group peptidase (beta-lactamase class C family)